MTAAKKILGATILAHALIHVCELAFPACAVLVTADLLGGGRQYGEIGLGASIFGLLFGAAALPAGRLVDKFGARSVLIALLFGTGAAMVGLALAPNWAVFIVALGVLGAVAGLYHPVGTTMLSLGLREQGKAMGYHGVGGNLGFAAAPLLVSGLAHLVGWRGTLAAIGALPVLLGVLVIFGRVGAGQRAAVKAAAAGEAEAGRAYALRPLLFLFLMAIFNGMAYRGLTTFLPAYLGERVKLFGPGVGPEVVGGAMATAVLVLGVVGQYLGGHLADRVRKEWLYASIFFICAPLLYLVSRLYNLPLVGMAGLFALLYFMNQPVGNALIPAYASARVRGLIFGLFFFMNFGVGSVMGKIAGYLGERFELRVIFVVLAATVLASAGLGVGLIIATGRGRDNKISHGDHGDAETRRREDG